jgi:A/G-specific adenine glycosylase
MWRLPERSAEAVANLPVVHRRKYGITRYRVTLHVHRAGTVKAVGGEVWHELADLDRLVMPPADRAALGEVL